MKHPVFHLKMSFFFSKTENKKAKQVLSGGLVPVGGWEDLRKGCRRVSMVEILCTHVYK
jgi:hypothetical protein